MIIFGKGSSGNRLARWRLKLEEDNYEIAHKSRKNNKNAEALSRIIINHFKQCKDFKFRILGSNEDEIGNLEEPFENEIGEDELMTDEFYPFVHIYKTKTLIDIFSVNTFNSVQKQKMYRVAKQ